MLKVVTEEMLIRALLVLVDLTAQVMVAWELKDREMLYVQVVQVVLVSS
jgi:hypothetical protein